MSLSHVDRGRWRWLPEYGWCHRPWWKVAINTLLRLAQAGRRKKWLVCSVTINGNDADPSDVPELLGYRMHKIERTP